MSHLPDESQKTSHLPDESGKMSDPPDQSKNLSSKPKKFWHLVTKNVTFVGLGAIGAATFYALGVLVNIIQLIDDSKRLQKPESEGWILAEITGHGYALFDKSLSNFFSWDSHSLPRDSKIISLIYTDNLKNEEQLNVGTILSDDVSVLTNQDYYGKIGENDFTKNNSETFQSFLINQEKTQNLLCLYVAGQRSGKGSTFFNIIRVKTIGGLKNSQPQAQVSRVSIERTPENIRKLCNGDPLIIKN